ncbi:MAG TPA: hypothetical protein PKC18_18165 [Lacipirellulaceae bacterium]|nr:hypothetical protein [Lacipirellulaceae bacterium]HMP08531.1 hypothetical protein [Lacipirellulaceae bacterium]
MSDENTKVALDAASWLYASPHEWVWTKEQQVAMARYCLLATAVLGEAASDLEKIVCTKDPDRGVILLSGDAPAHFDAVRRCRVYEHENFSPLGDALIALHEHLLSLQVTSEVKPPTHED